MFVGLILEEKVVDVFAVDVLLVVERLFEVFDIMEQLEAERLELNRSSFEEICLGFDPWLRTAYLTCISFISSIFSF